MIKEEEIFPVLQRLICSECGEEMKPGSISLMSNPPQFPHECACGHAEVHNLRYPNINFKDLNGNVLVTNV